MFKRIFTMFLCLMMVATAFAVTTTAAGGNANAYMIVSPVEANIGDTVTVTIGHREMNVSSFVLELDWNDEVVEVISINDGDLNYYDSDKGDRNMPATTVSTTLEANASNHVGIAYARSKETKCYANNSILTIKFKVIAAGTVNFVLSEDSSGTDGYKSIVSTKSVVAVEPCDHATTVAIPNGNGTHDIYCANPACQELVEDDVACSGGTPTCQDKPECAVCNGEYGTTVACKDDDQDGKCDWCGTSMTPATPSCTHPRTITKVLVDTEPTCVKAGSGRKLIICSACGATFTTEAYTIPATNFHVDENKDGKCDVCKTEMPVDHVHKLEHVEAKAATCTENGNIEYWYCEGCDSYFTDAEGKNKVDAADVVVPAAHKVEHVVAKAATCTENGNIEYWYCEGCDSYFTDAEGKNKVDAAAVVVPAAHKVEHVAAKEATGTENGNVEYWHCPECGGVWLDAECTVAAKPEDVVIPATGHVHKLVYTAAKEATCFEEGNLEYWYCEGCNCYFTDAEGKYNIAYLSLIIPVAHDIVHVEAKEATCFEEGNIEYWYCTKCGYAWLDEFCTKNTNLKAVILPVAHDIVHVEAKAPTCFEEGNIEYWYCTKCQYAWLDELCIRNTNLLAVILPVSHKIVHVEAKAPPATENGNIEYWYCTECGYAWLDELCTKNTNLKAVILPATGDINPPTGDATILYIAAVAVIATLGVAVIRFKKREEN